LLVVDTIVLLYLSQVKLVYLFYVYKIHYFYILYIGAVFGWGKNDFGQLGLNHKTNVSIPTELNTIRTARVKYISAGEDFSVFLTYVLYIILLFNYIYIYV
jgi:hypothetical protein